MAQIYVAGIHTDAGKTHFSAAFCYAFRDYGYFKLIQAGEPTDTSRVKEILDFAFDFEKKVDFRKQDFQKRNFDNSAIVDSKDFCGVDSKLQDLSGQNLNKKNASEQNLVGQDFMLANNKTKLHKEGIKLATPASPHIAKMRENLQYNGLEIPLPNLSENPNCIIELAGGLYTPLDDKHCMIDFMRANPRACVLVGRYYLGCINHILLSLEALKKANINVLCVVMSGGKTSTKSNNTTESKMLENPTKNIKSKESKRAQNPQNINDNDLSDNDLIDDFVSKYSGVPIVHLPFFEGANDFISCAKTLKNQMLQKIDFRF